MKHAFDDIKRARLSWLRMATCCWGAVSLSSLAQEVMYRCGQAYTNAPHNASLCERLATQAITVVPGMRPSGALSVRRPAPAETVDAGLQRTKTEPAYPVSPPQTERDVQARTIVAQELDKARQQLVQLQQEYNQGEPVKWAAEARNHQKYLDRVAALKASIERTERDIDSLQRELARRPELAKTGTP